MDERIGGRGGITHDLTKVEYVEDKQRETQLKKVAEERN